MDRISLSVASGRRPSENTDLAPNQHGAEDDLEAVEKVVSYDDDCGAPCGPALTGTDGFDARRGTWVVNGRRRGRPGETRRDSVRPGETR